MAKELVCVDVYTVKSGDTMYMIAQNYNVPLPLLMRVNRCNNPYSLRIGQKICIPGDKSQLAVPTEPMPPEPEVPACNGVLHTVVAGDTLYMIAKMHRVTLNAIMEANPTIDPYNMRIGMKICIPH